MPPIARLGHVILGGVPHARGSLAASGRRIQDQLVSTEFTRPTPALGATEGAPEGDPSPLPRKCCPTDDARPPVALLFRIF